MRSRRWQIALRGDDGFAFARARRHSAPKGDCEARLALFARLARLEAATERGAFLSFLPPGNPRAFDALPELTRAIRSDARYTWLVAMPYPWPRQLSVERRRINAGQLVGIARTQYVVVIDAFSDRCYSRHGVAEPRATCGKPITASSRIESRC